jgi:hypothetical protein
LGAKPEEWSARRTEPVSLEKSADISAALTANPAATAAENKNMFFPIFIISFLSV